MHNLWRSFVFSTKRDFDERGEIHNVHKEVFSTIQTNTFFNALRAEGEKENRRIEAGVEG